MRAAARGRVVTMLGEKVFTPKRVAQFSLAERVPAEHLLRRGAAAVDFAFVRRRTARFDRHTGRPGVAPVVRFQLALRGSLDGITAERRRAAAARRHLACAWFLGDDRDAVPPDHAVLSAGRPLGRHGSARTAGATGGRR